MNRNRALKAAAVVTAAALTVSGIGYCELRGTQSNVAADTSKVQKKIEDAINNTINRATTFGADKEETVYVISDANGDIQKKVVSDWLKNKNRSDTLEDKSSLSDIENVKGDEKFEKNKDGSIKWDANGSDIYYQGTTDKELPVDLKIKYYLDGREMKPEELAGKSGEIKIRFEYQNNESRKVDLNGKQVDMYVPFTMISGMMLPADKFSEVEVTDGKGKVISDGSNNIVMGISFSGLKEDLQNIKEDKELNIDIADAFEITANVEDFSLAMTMTVATSDVFSGIDVDSLDSIDDIEDTIEELSEAVGKLADGSESLKSGVYKLKDGSSQINENVGILSSKTGEFADGIKKADDGVAIMLSKMNEKDGAISGAKALEIGARTIDEKLKDVQDAVGKLSEGAGKLNESAGDIKDAVGKLSEGAGTIDEKIGELSEGAGKLSEGAETIDEKVGELSEGAGKLSEGAETIDEKVGALGEGIGKLAQGAKSLSTGLEKLENGLAGTEDSVGLTQAAAATLNGVDSLSQGAGQLENGIGQLQDSMISTLQQQIEQNTKLIEQYKQNIAKLSAGAGYESQIKELSDGIVAYTGANTALQGVIDSLTTSSGDVKAPSAYDGFNSLKAGASQINTQLSEDEDASGNATVKSGVSGIKNVLDGITTDEENGIPALVNGANAISQNLGTLAEDKTSGIPALKVGTSTLSETLGTLATDKKSGIPALKAGTSTLSETLGTLATDKKNGIPALKEGTGKVSEGLTTLNGSMPKFTKGTKDLSEGLSELNNAIPKLKDGSSDLSGGMTALLAGITTLSNTVGTELKPGLDTLYQAGLAFKTGVSTLHNYTSRLADGAAAAGDGSSEIAGGIAKLKDEAIEPINDALDEEFEDGIERIKKTVKLADDYDIYSDAIDGQDTSVKFIYKTAGIETED